MKINKVKIPFLPKTPLNTIVQKSFYSLGTATDILTLSCHKSFSYTPKEQKAYNLSQKLFEGKTRKDGKTPYFEHCKEVGNKLKTAGYDENVVAAGFLHDVVEDIEGWNHKKLKKLFGKKVADLVEEVTHQDANADWDTKTKNYISHLKTISPEGMAIAASDKISSIQGDVTAFKTKGIDFTQRLNAPAEKQKRKHITIYKIIMQAAPPKTPIKEEYEKSLKEYLEIIKKLNPKKTAV